MPRHAKASKFKRSLSLNQEPIRSENLYDYYFSAGLKARLRRRFLSRQLDAIFVALKLRQVSNMFETPAISRRQIALKIALGLHVRF